VVIDAASARRGPRGPYAKSERTKRSILDSALQVFAKSGYRSGSLRDVAEQVGISEAGLLHHFTNKKALLAAVLERRDEQTRERFEFDPGNGRVVLRSLVELVEYNASTPGVVELFCTLAAEATSARHPAHYYFVERYETATAMVRAAFEDLARRGELRDGVDPAAAGRGVVALMDGLQIQWLLDRDSVDMASDVRDHINRLLVEEIQSSATTTTGDGAV
jgi:AcrR family transcriptional regulator